VARALAAIAVVLTLTIASCGGNGDDSKTEAATAAGASGKSSRPAGPAKRKRPSLEKTVLGPKPGTPALAGSRKAVYLKARATCRSRGRRAIASDYGLHTGNAALVARLYAKKAFPGASQGAAFAGCVAGFR
jgi:hypothetical protein